MRVLHLADLHLGTETYGRRDPDTGLSTRLLDALRCLDTAVSHALSDSVDLVVIAGDVFDRPHPDPISQREFGLRIARLSREGIPVVIVLGDHDLPTSLTAADGLASLTSLEVPGVTVCRVPQVFVVETNEGAVEIAALPAAAASDLVTGNERASLTREQVSQLARQRLTERVASLDRARQGSLPSLLLGHLSVEGARAGSEVGMLVNRGYSIPREALVATGFDYLALGHLHRHQGLALDGSGPPIIYAGSIDRLDFDDANVVKGFVIADIGDGRPRYELLPTPARRFLTIRAAPGGEDPTSAALAAIGRRRMRDAIVRVVISSPVPAAIDRSAIRAALADAYFVGSVAVRTQRSKAQARAAARLLETTDPLDALKIYLRARQTPPARARALREAAARLISETDIDGPPAAAAASDS